MCGLGRQKEVMFFLNKKGLLIDFEEDKEPVPKKLAGTMGEAFETIYFHLIAAKCAVYPFFVFLKIFVFILNYIQKNKFYFWIYTIIFLTKNELKDYKNSLKFLNENGKRYTDLFKAFSKFSECVEIKNVFKPI